jgi:hypothetical protein
MLKRKEELFAQARARGLTQQAAAVEAGYAVGSTAMLMKRPEIQQRIDVLNAVIAERNAAEIARVVAPTRDWVLRELVENIIEAKNAKDRPSVNRGLELVGKEIGMFIARSMQIESPLQRLPADRLVALLQLIEQAMPGDEVLAVHQAAPQLTLTAEPTDDSW